MNDNKNLTLPTEAPQLITPDDIPKGQPDLQLVPQPTELIEMPAEIKAGLPAAATAELGSMMLSGSTEGGRFGAGVVPVENPGPQAIRQSLNTLPGSSIYEKPAPPSSQE